MVADPNGRGFVVVKVTKIVPGNALAAAGLISRTQSEFQQAVPNEYAEQMATAIKADSRRQAQRGGDRGGQASGSPAAARPIRPTTGPRILAIDNYDSFTFTLVDYLLALGADGHGREERHDGGR